MEGLRFVELDVKAHFSICASPGPHRQAVVAGREQMPTCLDAHLAVTSPWQGSGYHCIEWRFRRSAFPSASTAFGTLP